MKVGDYVRTINGIIAKIESKRNYTTGDYTGGENDFFLNINHSYQDYDKIVKSSPNIIDLIEVGDFITYEKNNIYINIPTSVNGVFDETTLTIVKMVDNEYLKDVNIKSIITHEQMESMKYKVKE